MAQTSTTNTTGQSAGFWKELESWKTPQTKDVASPVQVGSKAPSSPQLSLPDGKPTVVLFLRHCGCPFAEKSFKTLASLSDTYPQVHFVAISHSSSSATDQWIPQVGGAWAVDVVVDENRDIYAQWGLGTSSTWHVLKPSALWSVISLGKSEGIWNRPTESGSRWQTSGAFSVDRDGTVRWAHVSASADDLPDLEAATTALGLGSQQDK